MQLWRVPTLIQHPLNDTRSGQTSAPQIPQEDIQTELSSIVTHHFAALKPTLRKESHMMPRKLGARISCRAKVLRAYLSHTHYKHSFVSRKNWSFASGSMILELKNSCKRTQKLAHNPQEAFVCNKHRTPLSRRSKRSATSEQARNKRRLAWV